MLVDPWVIYTFVSTTLVITLIILAIAWVIRLAKRIRRLESEVFDLKRKNSDKM